MSWRRSKIKVVKCEMFSQHVKVLPQHSAFGVNSRFSRLMKEDGALDKPQEESGEKTDLYLAWDKSFALERKSLFCTFAGH